MSRAVADAVRGRVRTIAISNQGIDNVVDGRLVPAFAPWADVLYSSDRLWWANNRAAALAFAGVKMTIEEGNAQRGYFRHPSVYALKNGGAFGFDDRPDTLRTGRNSGYQGMHVAAHMGATTILLCGFDMHDPKPGARNHWFGDHHFRPGFVSPYAIFRHAFEVGVPEFTKRGIRVINCTPGSALTFIPFQPLEDAVREAEERRSARMQLLRTRSAVHAGDAAGAP